MMKMLVMAAVLLMGASSVASACCLLGAQGRPHDRGDAVRAYNWRHGLGYRLHRRSYARRSHVARPYAAR